MKWKWFCNHNIVVIKGEGVRACQKFAGEGGKDENKQELPLPL